MAAPPTFLAEDVLQHRAVTLADLAVFRGEVIAEIRAIDSRTPKSLLRMEEVMRRVGLRKSSIHAKIAAGEFPSPVDLGGGRAIGFVSTEIDRWVEETIAASRRNDAATRGARTPTKARRAREERKERLAGTDLQRDGHARAAVSAERQAAP